MRLEAALLTLVCAGRAFGLEAEGGFSHEKLTHHYADWDSVYMEATHSFAERQTLYGGLREVQRFGLHDSELGAGYYHPFSSRLTGQVEASMSPQHHVLPKSSAFGQLAFQLADGWVASGGLRHTEYTATSTRLVTATLERYFKGYRAFYTVYNGKPDDIGSATAHRIGLDRFYFGERSRTGFAITRGREVENVGPPIGIITSHVLAFAVLGRHWLSPDWAFTWELGTHEQGDLYRRTGARLGLRHRF